MDTEISIAQVNAIMPVAADKEKLINGHKMKEFMQQAHAALQQIKKS